MLKLSHLLARILQRAMAAAFLALQAHMDTKQKRKASSVGVFLNAETQRKFLKMSSNAQLQKELVYT